MPGLISLLGFVEQNCGEWGLQCLGSGRQETRVPILAMLLLFGCGTSGHSHYLIEFQLPHM